MYIKRIEFEWLIEIDTIIRIIVMFDTSFFFNLLMYCWERNKMKTQNICAICYGWHLTFLMQLNVIFNKFNVISNLHIYAFL